MNKTINAAIGGCSFILDEDAYNELDSYLARYRAGLDEYASNAHVMDELERKIADLLKQKLFGREVVDKAMILSIIGHLGYPKNHSSGSTGNSTYGRASDRTAPAHHLRKLYRDPDDQKIAGVCSGLSLFFGVDVTVIRILFIIAMICGSAGFWIYVVIWIAAPEARTPEEKCEMRGIPATAENIRKFTGRYQ